MKKLWEFHMKYCPIERSIRWWKHTYPSRKSIALHFLEERKEYRETLRQRNNN